MTAQLLCKHAPGSLVAFGRGGTRTAAQLLQDAAVVAAALPAPCADSQVLLVFREDRYLFTAALLGAWAAGHGVALPPNTQREAVLACAERPQTAAVLHDTTSGAPIRLAQLLAEGRQVPPLERVQIPARPDAAVLFTSGSTGAAQGVTKRGAQLLGEAETLARAFGLTEGTRFVGTVAPGHLYGLLFTVLTPLVSGGASLRETPLHAEAVAARLRLHEASVLVTVPAHLRGLRAVDAGNLGPVRHVFSSTAPLRAETAQAFREHHGLAVTEIFGSTETGGVASRRRDQGEGWRPLPGVSVDVGRDGHLRVDSPFLADDQPRPFVTSDLATLAEDGSFTHRGRADGVVKVGGHRVAISELEGHLLRQEGIEDAAVVPVENAATGHTQLLAALVADEGWDEARLRSCVGARFAPACAPRRALFVEALPREDNGKLQRARLLRLFGLRPDGRPINRSLKWGDDRAGGAQGAAREHRFELQVPADYAYFDGHFPNYPILPGAAQLSEIVLPCVRRARPELGALTHMSRLKFLGRIQPGEHLEVVVRWEPEGDAVDFSLRRGETTCAAGRLRFAEGAA